MRVDTPVGTMGIRGTTPRIDIAEDGSVKFSTLVEGKKDEAVVAPAGNKPTVAPRQRQAGKQSAAGKYVARATAATYNRLLQFDAKICLYC